MRLLTTSEAADYLRLSERKLYELVADRGVPCTKASGKWLFPQEELDRWLMSELSRPPGLGPRRAPGIVGGSQDSLLEWALRESGSGLATLTEGSEAGVRRLLADEVTAAAIHYHHADDEDGNLRLTRTRPGLHDCVLIAFAIREQGLLVAPGNPRGLGGLEDALASGARFAMRQKGAGAQMLLEVLLARHGRSVADVPALPARCLTGPDLAEAVRAGHADCGFATRAAARAAGLDFIPVTQERFDLLMRQAAYFRPPMQALAACLRGGAMAERAGALGGYDTSDAGAVRWAP
ncbi:MAG TPA: helix-turn-helix transcriptional regulator [Capillimicrobium sp.]|jgi:excisionase family DNA binding protein